MLIRLALINLPTRKCTNWVGSIQCKYIKTGAIIALKLGVNCRNIFILNSPVGTTVMLRQMCSFIESLQHTFGKSLKSLKQTLQGLHIE